MGEIIVRLTSNHIKLKGGEYICDLVRCRDCKKRKKNKFCLEHRRYERDDNGYCHHGTTDDVCMERGD